MILELLASGGGDSIDIIHHIQDQRLWNITGDIWFTKQMLVMSIASGVLMLFALAAAATQTLIPRGLANIFEPVMIFIRDEVVYPAMGEKSGKKLMPFFWTLFFFILFNNLAGLVPWSATPTSNISVTAALSLIALVLISAMGIIQHGPVGYVKSIVPDVPKPLWPFLLFIELIGIGSKHFALAIRLLANMLAGHMVILAFMSIIFIFKNYVIGATITFSVVGLSILEVFICFLQAYIFTFLTSMFLGSALEGH